MLLDHAAHHPLAFTHLWWGIELYRLKPHLSPHLLTVLHLSPMLCPLPLFQSDEPGPRGTGLV